MQSNQHIKDNAICVIDNGIWDNLFEKIKNQEDLTLLKIFINNISCQYNIDKKNIIKDFFNYIIRNKENLNVPEYFKFVENIIHFEDCKNSDYVNYSLVKLSTLLKELY
jgi:hypothetical protein